MFCCQPFSRCDNAVDALTAHCCLFTIYILSILLVYDPTYSQSKSTPDKRTTPKSTDLTNSACVRKILR